MKQISIMSVSRFNELVSEIATCYSKASCDLRWPCALRNVGGWKDIVPTEDEVNRLKVCLGDRHEELTESKLAQPSYGVVTLAKQPAPSDPQELEKRCKMFEEWIVMRKAYTSEVEAKIAELEKIIRNRRLVISQADALRLEEMLKRIFNPKLADEDLVYRLHNDGKITSTKGGCGVYGSRSVFCDSPPVRGIQTVFIHESGKIWKPFDAVDDDLVECRLEDAKSWLEEFHKVSYEL